MGKITAPFHKTGVTLVVPAFNEKDGIGAVLSDLQKVGEDPSVTLEVIVVDDGSTDGTSSLVDKFSARLIQHEENMGYGSSLKTGIKNATHELIGHCSS